MLRKNIKVNLGCGRLKFNDYVNVDEDSRVDPDITATFSEISNHFDRNSVDEILAIHSLYSLTFKELKEVAEILFETIAPGGTLIIESPDLKKILSKINSTKNFYDEIPYEQYIELIRPLLGCGYEDLVVAKQNKSAGHLVDQLFLKRILSSIGFEPIKITPPRYHQRDRDFRITAYKPYGSGVRTSVLFVANKGAPASTNVRCNMHLNYLKNRGWDVGLCYYDDITFSCKGDLNISKYDLIYCMKTGDVAAFDSIRFSLNSDQKIIYDCVDALWHSSHYGFAATQKILSASDFIFCENPYLMNQVEKIVGSRDRLLCVPTGTDTVSLAKFREKRLGSPAMLSQTKVIGWSGSAYTLNGLGKLLNVIASVPSLFPEAEIILRVLLMGNEIKVDIPNIPGVRTEIIFYGYDELRLFEELSKFDVGLYPEPFDEEEYLGRGYSKGYLYMAAGVPSVWQDSNALRTNQAFTPVLTQNVDYLSAKTHLDWLNCIRLMLTEGDLRRQLILNGNEAAESLFSADFACDNLDRALFSVKNGETYPNLLR